jgi:thiol-disulfide isomerase/thioredoxin
LVATVGGLAGRCDAEEIVGRVLDADGRPAASVPVVLAEEGRPLGLPNWRLEPSARANRTTTAADGRFRLPKPSGRFAVLALDDRGVAIQTAEQFARSPDLRLLRWGRVVGTVRIGARPDAGRPLSLPAGWGDGQLSVDANSESRADAHGRFAFDRVLPGTIAVGRTGPWPGAMTSDLAWVDVKPGETAEAVIGGIGRPAVGRLSFPDGTPPPRFTGGRAILSRVVPPIPFPPDHATWSATRKAEWRATWARTPKGSLAMRSQNRHIGAVAPDGTFRIEDVPAGLYQLIVMLEQRLAEAPPDAAPRVVAMVRREVEVPPIPGGRDRSDEPLRLDPTAVTVAASAPEVGEPAPEFAIRTLDDRPLRLADFRGRYVLLDFWATWCGPCAAELPHLKATFDEFGSDRRFAMIGLDLDDRPAAARPFVEARGMRWHQGFLGPWANSSVAASFDIQGLPSIWLIGPDGRVLARDLRGPAIRAKVAKALGRP